MKCEQVQKALAAFLEGELTPVDQLLLRQHLAGCDVCRSALGQATGQALQGLTAQVEPSPQAWSRLQARLAKDMPPSSIRLPPWLSRLAPGGNATHTTLVAGDKTMKKRFVLPVLAAVTAVAFAVLAMAQNVPTVSAQQIIERANAAQAAVKAASGINHIRTESYYNFQALAGNTLGTTTILDSYLDYRTGNLRNVTIDAGTGKVLDVFAYDGVNTYSTKGPLAATATEPLTIYRSPQNRVVIADINLPSGGAVDFEQLFAEMRADPQVTVEGKQTWSDGRTVYVLSTQQRGKYLKDPHSLQTKRMFFDASTYQLLEEKATFQLADQDIVVADVRYLVNETLPATTPIAWDVSDLQGVHFVDDADRTQGDLLPEKMTAQELATHTRTGYLLKTIPTGFNLEIEAPPKQDNETSYIYIASYRTEAGDYFVIQASGAPPVPPAGTADTVQCINADRMISPCEDKVQLNAMELYTTATGLKLYFLEDAVTSEGKHYPTVVVRAPDGTEFMITSTLPRERVKALAEDLVVVH